MLDATDPNLLRYRDHKRKIIMYFAWADAGLNPRLGVEYYEQVSERMGPSTAAEALSTPTLSAASHNCGRLQTYDLDDET